MAGVSAVEYATRATDESLWEADWVLTFELCDIVNMNPRQARDVIKLLKKRLGCKNPITQSIVLDVLETLSKNCGENVLIQIIECNILREMVKIVKKKSDSYLKKKVEILIGTWKDSFGGQGQYPEFCAAFKEIQSAGVEYSLQAQEGDALVSSETQDTTYPEAMPSKNAILSSVQSDGSHLRDIKKARGITHMLMEMLNALNSRDSEGAKQEVIADLVGKCHLYQNHFTSLSKNTRLEELLNECITLNDELQHVLNWHDDIVKGKPTKAVQMTTVAPLVVLNNEDYELEDDSSQLIRRNSKHPAEPNKGHSFSRSKQEYYNFVHPTSSKKSGAVAGRVYQVDGYGRAEKFSSAYDDKRLPGAPPIRATHQSFFQKQHDNSVTVDYSESSPKKSSLHPSTSQSTILSPSSGNSRKQLFTNKQQLSIGENSGTSYDNPTRNSHDHTSLQNLPTYSSKQPLNHSDGPDRLEKGSDQRTLGKQEQRSKNYTANHSEPSWKPHDQGVHQGNITSSLQQPLPASGGQVHHDTSSMNPNTMTEFCQKKQLYEQQQGRLSTSTSARYRQGKPSSPTEWPQSHSDGEDISPLPEDARSETSSKSRRLRAFLDLGKKGKKSSESKSESHRARR